MRYTPLFAALLITTPLTAQTAPKDQGDRYSGAAGASRSSVIAQNGMAATSQPLATQVALDILKAGGSAVDAAIAANAALGLMEPTGNGIGGDLFAIIWDPKTQKLYGLNASGRAPMGQSLKQLQDRTKKMPRSVRDSDGTIADWGSASVTIPGTVDGWFEMHGRFGKRPAPSPRPAALLVAQRVAHGLAVGAALLLERGELLGSGHADGRRRRGRRGGHGRLRRPRRCHAQHGRDGERDRPPDGAPVRHQGLA